MAFNGQNANTLTFHFLKSIKSIRVHGVASEFQKIHPMAPGMRLLTHRCPRGRFFSRKASIACRSQTAAPLLGPPGAPGPIGFAPELYKQSPEALGPMGGAMAFVFFGVFAPPMGLGGPFKRRQVHGA